MSGPRALETFAVHLETVLVPAVNTKLGVQVDAKVTSAQPDDGMSLRLTQIDESAGTLEGIRLTQLFLRVPRLGPVDDFTADLIRDEIRKKLGFKYSLGVQRTWLDMFDYGQDPPVKTGVLHIEPASSKIWVTRTSTDLGLIQSAMRLNIYFDEGDI